VDFNKAAGCRGYKLCARSRGDLRELARLFRVTPCAIHIADIQK
jgi:hypothetical protein